METITPTAPAVPEAAAPAATVSPAVLREVEKRMVALARFAGADHRIAPNAFRKPFSHKNWRALPEDIRLLHIRTRLTEQVIVQRAERTNRRTEPKPADAEPLPVKAVAKTLAQASRYVVPCADGCGKFHPARNHKPVLITCPGVRAPKRPADRATREIEEKLSKLRRTYQER
ncbi:hypothetical protein [Paenarthrobacter ureafaciens]|uniref:hypothetical protein n=1 Tax=Paenarthrobacter ureafaciens TaxID=37931 RepID=UPI003CED56D3